MIYVEEMSPEEEAEYLREREAEIERQKEREREWKRKWKREWKLMGKRRKWEENEDGQRIVLTGKLCYDTNNIRNVIYRELFPKYPKKRVYAVRFVQAEIEHRFRVASDNGRGLKKKEGGYWPGHFRRCISLVFSDIPGVVRDVNGKVYYLPEDFTIQEKEDEKCQILE